MFRIFAEDYFDMPEVCRVLGVRPERVHQMCRMMGLPIRVRDGDSILARSVVGRLYQALNPPYVPPEEAA